MARRVLDDGRWFDSSKAEEFEESTWFDGHNHISRATGDQWAHETLYRTAGGRWILHSWSQWQGSNESYEEISNEHAARWLVLNEHKEHKACAKAMQDLEVE